MRTRPLGPLEVSVVGLGCNNFGRRIDEDATRAVVDAALDVGVTFLDTADVYGDGLSETYLGRVLDGRRDRVVLAPTGELDEDGFPIYDVVDESISGQFLGNAGVCEFLD